MATSRAVQNRFQKTTARSIKSFTIGRGGLRVVIKKRPYLNKVFVCDAARDDLNALLSTVMLAYASGQEVVLEYDSLQLQQGSTGGNEKKLVAIGVGSSPKFDD